MRGVATALAGIKVIQIDVHQNQAREQRKLTGLYFHSPEKNGAFYRQIISQKNSRGFPGDIEISKTDSGMTGETSG